MPVYPTRQLQPSERPVERSHVEATAGSGLTPIDTWGYIALVDMAGAWSIESPTMKRINKPDLETAAELLRRKQ